MEKYVLDWENYVALARQAIEEGSVLLRNEKQALPILPGETVSVFGRIQLDYYKSGTGSGGLVNVNYVHSILDGLRAKRTISVNEKLAEVYKNWTKEHPFDKGKGWGGEPWCQEEMPLTEELVKEAADASDIAVVIIGRTAGEDQDNKKEEGSYYLTALEKDMLAKVCAEFSRVAVLLNVGNIIDMSWVEEYQPTAVLYVWQGGMEGGMGVANVLCGEAGPSGKLADTIARSIEDYPADKNFGDPDQNIYEEDIYVGYRYFETFAKEKVLYPFGFGLTYTTFEVSDLAVEEHGSDNLLVTASVINTGNHSGKEVVQVYVNPPQGKLGKPLRNLVAFAKTTEIDPGDSEILLLSINLDQLASYDDSGVTGHKSCYVREPGVYEFYVGTDVRSAALVGTWEEKELTVVEQLSENMAPVLPFERLRPVMQADGSFTEGREAAPLRTVNIEERRKAHLPVCEAYTGEKGYRLAEVKKGKISMGAFLAQISDDDLSEMVNGEGMSSPKVTPGTAAAFGGITDNLQKFGIPVGCCTDGPSGMRMDCGTNAFSLPNGTLFACTFHPALNADIYEMEGLEMRNNHIDTLLGPGINIHRYPLNGRNFEYFSEDPLLTGKCAAAQLQGMARAGVTGTIKHFCANNQEHRRHFVNGVVSERALRELYLKGFEIAVKEGKAYSIMTTYGPVNGIWTAGNYDQNTRILREEWNYDGIVMTDWWAKVNDEGEEANHENLAAMVRAQNDIYMVTGNARTYQSNVKEALKNGTLTRAELVRCAENICRFLMRSPVMDRLMGEEETVTILNQPEDQVMTADFDIEYHPVSTGKTVISLDGVASERGKVHTVGVTFEKMGIYRISVTASSEAGELAQMPVSVFNDGTLLSVFTFTGSHGESRTMETEAGIWGANHYFRLLFGQGGLNLHEMSFEFVEDLKMPM